MRRGFFFCLMLTLSACGDKVTQVHHHYHTKDERSLTNQQGDRDDFVALERLLNEKRPNLALAEFIAKRIGGNGQIDISEFLEGVSPS